MLPLQRDYFSYTKEFNVVYMVYFLHQKIKSESAQCQF